MQSWTYWTLVIIHAVAAGLCLFIALQDFRERAVSIGLFLGLAGLGLVRTVLQDDWGALLPPIFNGLLVLAIMGIVWLWMRVVRKAAPNEMFLGAGDIVLLISLGCWLNVLSFVLFFVGSIWIILAGTLLWRRMKQLGADWPIPLAGFQAILFIPVLVFLFWAQMNSTGTLSGFGIEHFQLQLTAK